MRFLSALIALTLIGTIAALSNARAGDVKIVKAEASQAADKTWRFEVTLLHDDTGWDHYADLWEVYAPDGTLLGKRVLAHPHVNEQPFTRSLSGVEVPDGTHQVIIKARDSVHGVSPQEFELKLPR
ncbi:hypothetical protein [Roseibium sp.]|uniref:hypothetical protein n=1 Tax=Roseibium sp. TaxID=1936156 RepID=UPI003B52886C